MRKETLKYANGLGNEISEYFQPSIRLRIFKRKKRAGVIQQLWTSNLGNQEWRELEIVIE